MRSAAVKRWVSTKNDMYPVLSTIAVLPTFDLQYPGKFGNVGIGEISPEFLNKSFPCIH